MHARRLCAARRSLVAADALLHFHAVTSGYGAAGGWAAPACAAASSRLVAAQPQLRRTLSTLPTLPPRGAPRAATAAAAEAGGDDDDGDETEAGVRGTDTGDVRMPALSAEDVKYWHDLMDEKHVTLPSAVGMLPHLDMDDPLGVDKARDGVSSAAHGIYATTLRFKAQHPRTVVLVRVGEFFEAMGFDAVLLVQYAGLNPMGNDPFKAGLPLGNLRATLTQLLGVGLSVAIVEEAPAERRYGQVTARKERYLGGVVSPSSPEYVHGMVRMQNDGSAGGFQLTAAPTLGVAHAARGYTLIELHPDVLTYSVLEGLAEQALVARLWAAPSAPLYLHSTLDKLPGYGRGTFGGGRSRHEGAALAAALQNRTASQRYDGPTVDALLNAVRKDAGLAPEQLFRRADASLMADAPRPLFLSAALALGVVHSSGVPDLVQSLLPPSTPRAVVDKMRALLLSPPSESVARALRDAHDALHSCAAPVPAPPLVPSGKLARLITARECSAAFFADIHALCTAVHRLWADPELSRIGEALLAPAQFATGTTLDAARLKIDCDAAIALVQRVLAPSLLAESHGAGESPQLPRAELLGSAVRARAAGGSSTEPAWAAAWPDGDAPLEPEAVPMDMLRENETFRGKVRREQLQSEYDAVDAALAALDAAVHDDLMPFENAWRGASAKGPAKAAGAKSSAAAKVAILYDSNNNAVWLKAPKGATAASWAQAVPQELHAALIAPSDRFGRPEKSNGLRHSTERVEQAAEAYRSAAKAADDAVIAALQAASEKLEPWLPSLVGAAELTLYLRMCTEHTCEARRRNWCLPELGSEGSPWRMTKLTPPWMPRGGSDTVSNDFECDGMLLLTGPNMAGKSTIARAAGTAALLANCGLHVPASSAQVPRFRAFFVRMASADAPLEGLSHWGLDMKEAAAVTTGAELGPGACVMLDELCQGTEVAHATAMAAALLETLDNSKARGIFATHLHGVLRLPLELRNTVRMAMETQRDASGALRPTLRLVAGECTESLAFEVAKDCGIQQQLLDRAAVLLQHLETDTSPPSRDTPRAELPVPAAAQQLSQSTAALQLPAQSSAAAHPSVPPMLFPLAEAGEVLQEQFEHLFPGETCKLHSQLLTMRLKPGPFVVGRSCVYLLRIVDQAGGVQLYCGQSVDLPSRLQAHTKTHRAAAHKEAMYVIVPGGSSESDARQLETNTIKTLVAAGFPLLSSHDGNKRNFGK